MFGNVFHRLVSMFVVERLVNCRALERSLDIRTACNECSVPELFHFENLKLCAKCLFEPDDDFLFDEIDNSDEIVFAPKRELQRHGVCTETRADSADDVIEIRSHAVHLVDEADSRHAILVRLTPDGFDCGCTPATESNTQTAPSSTRKERSTSTVKSTWPGVSMMLTRYFLPKRSQLAVVAALVMVIPRSTLLLHPVHRGSAFVHGTDLVGHACVE